MLWELVAGQRLDFWRQLYYINEKRICPRKTKRYKQWIKVRNVSEEDSDSFMLWVWAIAHPVRLVTLTTSNEDRKQCKLINLQKFKYIIQKNVPAFGEQKG